VVVELSSPEASENKRAPAKISESRICENAIWMFPFNGILVSFSPRFCFNICRTQSSVIVASSSFEQAANAIKMKIRKLELKSALDLDFIIVLIPWCF